MRKYIPALLLAAGLPALAIAAPLGHGNGPGCGGPGMGHNANCDGSGPCARGDFGPKHGGQNYGKHQGFHFGMNNMSPEQRDKMQKIMREQTKARYEIKQKYYNKLSEADKKAMADELQKSRDDARKEMRATLTPEQQKSFDERQKWQDERMKEWKEFQDWKASKAGK